MNFGFLSQLNTKKILILVAFLALCLALGFGVYWLFFRPAVTEVSVSEDSQSGSLPGAGEGSGAGIIGDGSGLPRSGEASDEVGEEERDKIARGGVTSVLPLIEDEVRGFELAVDGRSINFYNTMDNKFYTLSADGQQPILLSNQEFFEVQDAIWSWDRNSAIILYPDGNKILYDFSKDKQITLSANLHEPVFSNNNQVAYKHIEQGSSNNWIAITDLNTSRASLVEAMGENYDQVQINWSPTNQVVALYSEPTGINSSEVFFIGLAGENFKSLEVEGSQFMGFWSPSGRRLLYSTVSDNNNYNPQLWIADAEGDNIGRNKFNLGLSTWADKCVFADEKTVYCAVPKELGRGAGLFADLKPATDDLIYKIDLTTGYSQMIADPQSDEVSKFTIDKIKISRDGRYLFFSDESTRKVYRLQLK